ncbi:MAG: DUF5715 family protein [Acidobacteriaceae bacterium]
MMRTKAHVALLSALVCLQLCAVPLLARPTRSLARHSEGRLIVAQPTQRLTRERAARRRANARLGAHGRSHADAHASASEQHIAVNLSRYAGPTAPHSSATHHAHTSLASNPETDRVHAWMLVHEEQQRSLAAQTAGSTASGNEPVEDDSATLINVGGVLRPLNEVHPLPSIEEEAATPVILPALRVSALYDSHGHLMVPQPLYGSRENLLHQNEMANREGLGRVRDDADLLDLRRQHKLVALPQSEALRVDDRLPEDRRFSRPWTAAFLAALARDHYSSFHLPLQVNSAVRTVEFQQRLERSNANAAPPTGETASPHLTGEAVDIAKHGLSITEIAWMRAYLQPLIEQGKIDVEEEFQQACFHISVYKSYAPDTTSSVTLATAR